MRAVKVIAAFILLITFNSNILAQSADEVINNYIKAMGGLEKLQSVKSMRMEGKFAMGPMEVAFKQTYKRPLMVIMEVTIQDKLMIQAYDGTQGWMLNPFTGKTEPEAMPKDAEKAMKRNADFEGLLINYKEKGNQAELIGKEKVDSTEAYNIKLTNKEGEISNYYISAESYLLLKEVSVMKTEGKEATIETIVSDYKPVDGMMIPYSIELKVSENPMGSQKITIEKVELNVAVEDSFFKMPEKKQ